MRRHTIDSLPQRCLIRLDQAWYCESCRAISNDATCCNCASEEHTAQLGLWLDREREPIRVPQTGAFLTVIPTSKKGPEIANLIPMPQRVPRAS
jgi:hypothetical protein